MPIVFAQVTRLVALVYLADSAFEQMSATVLSSSTTTFSPMESTRMNHESADVIIVGAGVAGLVAARELRRSGRNVRALEARDRVGGRTLSQRVGREILDLGGPCW
jgi:ribulose 1,5-bisphosphate synthetase/thiazole synthase